MPIDRTLYAAFQEAELANLNTVRQVHEMNLVIQTLMLTGALPLSEEHRSGYEQFLRAQIADYAQSTQEGRAFVRQMAADFHLVDPVEVT